MTTIITFGSQMSQRSKEHEKPSLVAGYDRVPALRSEQPPLFEHGLRSADVKTQKRGLSSPRLSRSRNITQSTASFSHG